LSYLSTVKFTTRYPLDFSVTVFVCGAYGAGGVSLSLNVDAAPVYLETGPVADNEKVRLQDPSRVTGGDR
jgi:hypothetical protein